MAHTYTFKSVDGGVAKFKRDSGNYHTPEYAVYEDQSASTYTNYNFVHNNILYKVQNAGKVRIVGSGSVSSNNDVVDN